MIIFGSDEYNKNKYLFRDDLIDNYCEMWPSAVSTMFNGFNDVVVCVTLYNIYICACAFANLYVRWFRRRATVGGR